MKINKKFDLTIISLLISLISLSSVSIFKIYNEKIVASYLEGLTKVEYLSSGIQRVAKFEFEKNYDITLQNNIDEMFFEIFEFDDSIKLEEFENTKLETIEDLNNLNNLDLTKDIVYSDYLKLKVFYSNESIENLLFEFADNLSLFKFAVADFRAELEDSRETLFKISENNYAISEKLIHTIEDTINSKIDLINKVGIYIFFNVIIVALILLQKLRNTNSELSKTKELSKDMYIDISTGLYNRSKCQDLLNNYIEPDDRKERAIIIFDLNYLKKTNDTLGHRAGDDLIQSFAFQLKEATKIFPYDIFVARYGGDEFMAYFSSVVDKDIKIYLKEVKFLVDKFNTEESKAFKISYAVGYAITSAETKLLTTQQLFDIADEDMYKNKIATKLNFENK